MDSGTKVCHFLKEIKRTELEAAVNVAWTQPEKYCTDFDTTVSYLGQRVTKKWTTMKSISTAKAGSQPVKPKVAACTWKIECMMYPKAIWNSMITEQHMQVRKWHEQQGIKPITKQPRQQLGLLLLRLSLGLVLNPRRVMSRRNRERLPINQHGEET